MALDFFFSTLGWLLKLTLFFWGGRLASLGRCGDKSSLGLQGSFFAVFEPMSRFLFSLDIRTFVREQFFPCRMNNGDAVSCACFLLLLLEILSLPRRRNSRTFFSSLIEA